MERGLQVVVEESVVISTTEVGDQHAEPSGLGDLEVTEYVARIPRRSLERKDGPSVHLATPKQDSCLTNSPLHSFIVPLTC